MNRSGPFQLRKRLRVNASATQNEPTAATASTARCRSGCAGHWSMNRGRTSSTAAVSGSHSAMPRTTGGKWVVGKKMPYRSIIGMRNGVK